MYGKNIGFQNFGHYMGIKHLFYILLLVVLLNASSAWAHFGMIIPTDTMVMKDESRTIKLTLSFSHPFEGAGLDMTMPSAFGVMNSDGVQDLIPTLEQTKVMNQRGWAAKYVINRPGAYVFFMEMAPFWEPAEDCYIVHYCKTVVAAFGDEQGWDQELGLKTEIVPLTRPFGLYAGNVFQGIVKVDKKPVPFSTVEVEYFNEDGSANAPTIDMMTQVIKTDQNGVFTFGVPKPGWWGFLGINNSRDKIKNNGVSKPVELGAVIWVKFHPWVSY